MTAKAVANRKVRFETELSQLSNNDIFKIGVLLGVPKDLPGNKSYYISVVADKLIEQNYRGEVNVKAITDKYARKDELTSALKAHTREHINAIADILGITSANPIPEIVDVLITLDYRGPIFGAEIRDWNEIGRAS